MAIPKRSTKENPCERIRNYSKATSRKPKRAKLEKTSAAGPFGTTVLTDALKTGLGFLSGAAGTVLEKALSWLFLPTVFGAGFITVHAIFGAAKQMARGYARSSDEWARDEAIKTVCEELANEFEAAAIAEEEKAKQRKGPLS